MISRSVIRTGTKATREGMLLGMGNPLLDISVECEDSFLAKYGLKPNDAVLANDRHAKIYEEMKRMKNVEFTAGGATQNSARVCQWVLGLPKAVSFMGCVGSDENAAILRSRAEADGVWVDYQVCQDQPTGTCAVVITSKGKNRSLCANLGAANCFSVDHIADESRWAMIEQAKMYYISGFFLTVSPETVMRVAEHSAAHGKTFCLNLAAPFICDHFTDRIKAALGYVDILVGNDSEFSTFGKAMGLESSDPVEVGKFVSSFPFRLHLTDKKRLSLITQGHRPVICVLGDTVTEFPIPHLTGDQIVDTNGAGDAFVGGFLAQYVIGRSLEECIDCGIWAAHQIIRQPGVKLPDGKCKYSGRYVIG